MGSGKSTVAAELAVRLGRVCLELDDEIERREGMPISGIFAARGEPYFRALEKRVLESTLERRGMVISCGGGIVIDPDNIRLMEENGILICLDVTPEAAYERTRGHSHRPLLNVPDPLGRIRELMEKRKPCYDRIRHHVDTAGGDPATIARRICALLEAV